MVKLTAFIFGSVMHLYWGCTHKIMELWTISIKLSIFFLKKITFTLFSTCMQNVLWDTHTISPVRYKLCKLVPVSSPLSQWGVWFHAITWYCCHILTAEPHFDSETENTHIHTHTGTHTEYLNTSSIEIYLQSGKWAHVILWSHTWFAQVGKLNGHAWKAISCVPSLINSSKFWSRFVSNDKTSWTLTL